MSALQVIIALLVLIVIAVGLFLALKLHRLKKGRIKAEQQYSRMLVNRVSTMGSVQSLSVLPLVDYFNGPGELKTEAGVSYLLRAGEINILMDTGSNPGKEHPSPLLSNLHALGFSEKDIDMIFISHVHFDHVGGRDEAKEGTFSLSHGPVELPRIPVYSPEPLRPSAFNPGPEVIVTREPRVLANGVTGIGVIPRYLFMIGETNEQALAVNVAGKGIVLIVGCGHQGIERILERAQGLFAEPIYALVGGLHYPVKGGRMKLGPINLQQIVAADRPPWAGLNEESVDQAIAALRAAGVRRIALSGHDSSDWSIERFRAAFEGSFSVLKVGEAVTF